MRLTRTAILIVCFTWMMGCGEEYFSTPQKTIQHYVKNKTVGSMAELEACLNSFTTADRKWFETNSGLLCGKMYGPDCPGDKVSQQTTIWTDAFEPEGPNSGDITSAEIDEKAGKATLVVDGKTLRMVKESGNWKIKGMFGAPERLKEKYLSGN